jgi:hypothetical protein
LLPSLGFKVPMQANAKARPLLCAQCKAAVSAALFAFAVLHWAFSPGSGCAVSSGPAGLPTRSCKTARKAGSSFCFKPTAAPWVLDPSKAAVNRWIKGSYVVGIALLGMMESPARWVIKRDGLWPPASPKSFVAFWGFEGRLRLPSQAFAASSRVLATPMQREAPLPRRFALRL